MRRTSLGQSKTASVSAEKLTDSFVTADRAFCRFLLTVYRVRPQWKSLQTDLEPLWKQLCDYEQMYAEVTAENAEKVFGSPGVLNDDALRNLRHKLDVAREADIDKPRQIIKEMKSVLDSIRNARTQLNYDLAEIDLVALDVEDADNGSPSSHLRESYSRMVKRYDDVVQCLWQDVSEADSILNSFENHYQWQGSVIGPKHLDHIKSSFSEESAQLLCPLRCYIESQGVKLDQIKTRSSLSTASPTHQTPKSSRKA